MIKPVFYITILISVLLNHTWAQQNLVYNGDFEEYDSCPTNPSFPGDLQIEHCIGWTAPRKEGTSDYFNVCNNPINGGLAGVPSNIISYQYPKTGNGYCGLFTWALNPDGTNYREYIQTKLLNPLEGGKIYKLSFYVSYDGFNYSIEKIGALLSNSSFTEDNASPIVANPQVVNRNGNLTDSLNWMKIEGEFISSGDEEYLTIGYFEDSSKVMDTLNTFDVEFCASQSYYYIDAIELVEIDKELPNVFTPNGDGVNDFFSFNIWVEKFIVINRWGDLIAEMGSGIPLWDGTNLKGDIMSDGVYYYIIQSGNYKRTGFIQLIK